MQTVGDLDNAFRLYVDKADSQGSADFLLGERQQFLNDAQLRLCRELVSGKTDNQDAVDLRRTLSTYAELTINDGVETDSVSLPDDYLHYGRATAQLAEPYSQYRVPLTIVSEDELSRLLDDPFNNPQIGNPVGCFLYGQLSYYPAGSATKVQLSYYRPAAELDLATPGQVPDIPFALRPTLVQYAVQLALESVTDPRFQTQAAIAKVTANP